jgi:hypothetical protein
MQVFFFIWGCCNELCLLLYYYLFGLAADPFSVVQLDNGVTLQFGLSHNVCNNMQVFFIWGCGNEFCLVLYYYLFGLADPFCIVVWLDNGVTLQFRLSHNVT